MGPTYRAFAALLGQAPLDYFGLTHEVLKVKLQATGGARTWSHQIRELAVLEYLFTRLFDASR